MVKSGIADGKKSALPVIAAAIAVIVILAFVFIGLQPSAPMPGSDRDSYGCVPSEGYTWCQEKGKCLRAWEESCASLGNLAVKPPAASGGAQNALNSTNKPVERDSYGCFKSDGFVWCAEKQKCIKPFEESCVSANVTFVAANDAGGSSREIIVTPDMDSHGCFAPEGYVWCEAKQKCIIASNETCSEEQSSQVPASAANTPSALDVASPSRDASLVSNTSIPTGSNGSPPPLIVGNDSDAHGCEASAGYSWCESTQKCYRPQDEGCQSSLSPSELVEQYNASNNSLLVGNDSDAHGCEASAGYSWCEASQKCIRLWEENCTASAPPTPSPCTQLGGTIIDISGSCPSGNISPYPDLAVKNKTCCFAQ